MSLPTKVDFIKDRFDPFTEIYSPNNISDEQHTIPSSSPFYIRAKEVIKEDAPSSIEIWTGAGKTGDQYTEVSSAPGPGEFQVDYKYQSGYIRFNEANGNTGIYITYKGLGDVIQAAHINTVQNVLNLDNVPLTAVGLASNSVETAKIKNANVTSAKIKTGTGSFTNITVGSTNVIMHDYCFFPNVHGDSVGNTATLKAALSGQDSIYVGAFMLDDVIGTVDVYWRYISSSGPPEIWIVRDDAKGIYTIWEADDPAPGGKPPIECFDKDGNKVGKTILIIPPKNYAELKAQCQKNMAEKKSGAKSIGKILLEEWEIDERSSPKRPLGLAVDILVKRLKKKSK